MEGVIPKNIVHIDIDSVIVMPNHLHGILIINDNNNNFNVGARRCIAPTVLNLIHLDQGTECRAPMHE